MDHLADAPIANILILAGVIFLAVGLFGRIGGFIGSIFGNIEAGTNSRVLAGALGSVLILGGAWMHQQSDKSAFHAAAPAESATNSTSKTIPAPVATMDSKTTPPVTRNDGGPAKAKVTADASVPKKTQPYLAPTIPSADREKLPATPAAVGDERLIGTWTNLMPRSDSIRRFEIVRDAQGMNVHLWYDCPSGDCDVGHYRLDFSGSTPTYEYNSSNRRRVTYLTLQTLNVLHVRIELFENGAWYKRNHWVFTKSTISETLKSAFSRYFEAPGEKAFAMAPGMYSYQHSQASLDSAKQKALEHCEKRAARSCFLILVNNDPAQ